MRCQNWPCRVVAGKTGTARGKDRSSIPANQPSCARLSGVDRREAIRDSRDPHGVETSLFESVHRRHFYPVLRKLGPFRLNTRKFARRCRPRGKWVLLSPPLRGLLRGGPYAHTHIRAGIDPDVWQGPPPRRSEPPHGPCLDALVRRGCTTLYSCFREATSRKI